VNAAPEAQPAADPSALAQAPIDAPKLAVDDDGWQDTRPAPWRRYFARVFDTLLFAWTLSFVLSTLLAATAPTAFEVFYGDDGLLGIPAIDMVLTVLMPVPFLALLLGLTGTTPGKWLMGVRVTRRDGSAIGIENALQRELNVYLAGMGLGIPFISLVTLIKSHNRLTTDRVTSWDRGNDWVVTHRPMGPAQVLLGTLGVLAVIAARIILQVLAA